MATPVPITSLVQTRESAVNLTSGAPQTLRLNLNVPTPHIYRRLYMGWITWQATGVKVVASLRFSGNPGNEQWPVWEWVWGPEQMPEGIVAIPQPIPKFAAFPSFKVSNLITATDQQYPYDGMPGSLVVAHSFVDPAMNTGAPAPFQITMHPFPMIGEFGNAELKLTFSCLSNPTGATAGACAAWFAMASDVARA